jgi:thymidylate synthase ThyX
MNFNAKMVADSINDHGNRLMTMEITFPRFILAELNTHRMLSKNSASSRAIKFEKMVEAVKKNPFIPLRWMKDHTGMQGTDYLNPIASGYAEEKWLEGRDVSIEIASYLNQTEGVTKQICNRLLEPFMWHTVLISGTEWDNFFALRAHEAAEIHMQRLAELMLECANSSTPVLLQPGEWHIPYGENLNKESLIELIEEHEFLAPDRKQVMYDLMRVKVASARCAQVSYTVVGEDNKPMDYRKLAGLHDRLLKAGHMSPFEHCARNMTDNERSRWTAGPAKAHGWCGNYRGWIQYRKMIPGENKSDSRLKIHETHYGPKAI